MKISKAVIIFLSTVVIPSLLFAIISKDIEAFFGDERSKITGVVVLLLIAFLSWRIYSVRHKEELLNQYDLFKETRELKPEDLGFQEINPGEPVKPRLRPYYSIYIPRTAIPYNRRDDNLTSIDSSQIYTEDQLAEYLVKNSSGGLLLIGRPTEGKTRTLFEIIRQLSDFVVIRIEQGVKLTDAALELLRGKKVVWLVDDIHTLAKSDSSGFTFNALLNKLSTVASHCVLAGTSRNSRELDKLDLATGESVGEFYRAFKLKLVLTPPNYEDIERLKAVIRNTDTRKFPTLGAICMREHFDEMHRRFRKMEELERLCVLSLILLNKAFIYEMLQQQVRAVLSDVFEERTLKDITFQHALRRLKEDGFIRSMTMSGAINPEAAYITGEEAEYYYTEETSRKAEDYMTALADCLSRNGDAYGMNCLALSHYDSNRTDMAISLLEQINSQFGESVNPVLREQVAKAFVNKGMMLAELANDQEAIKCYSLVNERYRDASEPELREQVAKALFNKGIELGKLDSKQAIACYDLIDERYRDALEPELRGWVAKALFNKGDEFGKLDKHEQVIACSDLIDQRYKDAAEPELRESLVRALFNKGVALTRLDRREQAIACYNLMDERYGDAPESALREWVAKALLNKEIMLGLDGNREQAIVCFNLVEKRYKNSAEPSVQAIVNEATAFFRAKLREDNRP